MKGSLAKAARIFDALRIKMEAEQGTPVAVSEPVAEVAVADAPAQAETTDAVVPTPAAQDVTAEVAVETPETPAE
jgi:large subunit ribosomal protein L10